MSIKRKISVFQKKNTNAKNIEKRQPFFNTNDFQPLPSKPNTNASKQDYSRIINVSPRNYNTHSTSATTETSFPQQQLFHLSRLKHNPIQHQRQSNWFQLLNNLHLMNPLTRIKVISPPKGNIYLSDVHKASNETQSKCSRVRNSKNLWKVKLSWCHHRREQQDRK